MVRTTIVVVCKPCIVCKNQSELEVVKDDFDRWQAGELIQNAMPYLDSAQRELLISGTHEHCWEWLMSAEGGD